MAWRSSLSSAVKELRLHLSQTSTGSEGMRCANPDASTGPEVSCPSRARNFIKNNYAALKEANPNLPILVREAQSVEARIFAQYGGWTSGKARSNWTSDSPSFGQKTEGSSEKQWSRVSRRSKSTRRWSSWQRGSERDGRGEFLRTNLSASWNGQRILMGGSREGMYRLRILQSVCYNGVSIAFF
jgi:NADH dehydrogenase (ubiquinone) 1 alpha subcomplex subunit 2